MSDPLDATQANASTDDDKTQPSELENEDLLRRLKNWFQQARDASSEWRKNAREDYAFYSGEQWDLQDKARLADQLRPVITFNRIAPTIDTVAGMEVNNRQEIRCYPRVASGSSPAPVAPSPGGMPAPSISAGSNYGPSSGSLNTSMNGLQPPQPSPNGQPSMAPQPSPPINAAPSMTSPSPIPTEGAQTEQLTNAIKWVRDECDAEDAESDAFKDSVICGMGWTETRLDYETEPDGMIDQDRIDPLEMYYDPFARKQNLTDARFVMHRTEIDIETARSMFPDAEDEDLHAIWATVDEQSQEPQDATQDRFYQDDGKTPAGLGTRRKITIVHAQWFEKEAFYRVADPLSQDVKSLSVKEYKQAANRLATLAPSAPPLKGVKQTRRVYKRAFLGRVVLETGDAPCKWKFSFQAITGKRDRNKKIWYGIVQSMKDPQRWANKFFSTIIHNIASQGKGIIAERGTFEDDNTAQDDWAHPDRIVFTKAGAIAAQKLMPKPAGTFPTGLPDMLTFALSSLRDVSGINLEIMGQNTNDQAASLEWQRRKSAFSILAGYFDALRHYRKEQGRLLIYLVQEYISDGRLMRITTDNGQPQYVPLNRSPKFVEYDVIVDDAPSSPDQKEATWNILGGMMPLLAKLPIPLSVWTEIVKQSPLPDSFSAKIAGLLQANAANGPPPDPAMVKVQLEAQADQAAQVAKLQADQQRTDAEMKQKAQETAFDQQVEATRAHNDTLQAANSAQLQRDEAAAKIALIREEMTAKLEIERERMRMEAEIEREKIGMQRDVEGQKVDVQAQAAGVKSPVKPKGPDPLLEGLKGLAKAHSDGMKEHTQALVAEMKRPKKVVFGANGRPSGVE